MLTVDQMRTVMADPEFDRVEKLNAIMLRSYKSNDRHQVRSDHRADRGQRGRRIMKANGTEETISPLAGQWTTKHGAMGTGPREEDGH